MNLTEHPFYTRLEARKKGFSFAIAHLDRLLGNAGLDKIFIVETGTARIEGNWEGDGQSTLIWDWVYHQTNGRIQAVSIDSDGEAIETAKTQTRSVLYLHSDSMKVLGTLSEIPKTYLLYLDSFDWHPSIHLESSFHHISELALVYASLPAGCLIMVDDRHHETQGKHFMVQQFFEKQGIPPAFKGYQIAWIKPPFANSATSGTNG